MNLIEKIIKTQTAEYWEEKFNDYAVPAARVRNLDEILDERQVKERRVTQKLKIPGIKNSLHMPTLGFKIDNKVVAPQKPPPKLGQDNHHLIKNE